MKRLMIVLLGVGFVLCLGGVAGTQSQWYEVTFTGADIWNMSAGRRGLATPSGQTAPRRYRDLDAGAKPIVATTYGVDGGRAQRYGNRVQRMGSEFPGRLCLRRDQPLGQRRCRSKSVGRELRGGP